MLILYLFSQMSDTEESLLSTKCLCEALVAKNIIYYIYIYIYALNLNTKHSPLSTTTINASVRTLYHHHPSSSSFKKLRISSACQGSEKKTKKALLEGVLILLINAGGQTCYLEFYIILAYLKSSCIV
jgi:hypothetical protein